MGHEAAIVHVAEWLYASNVVVFTGRTLNANKLAKPMQIFERCLQHDFDFWRLTYGYSNKLGKGQKGGLYRLFRDTILLPALFRCRSKQLNIEPPIQRFSYKSARLRSADLAPRAIIGWEMAVEDDPLGGVEREYRDCE